MEPKQLRAEGNKLLHDTMKQLITISSGSILLMITFWEKIFKQPLWRGYVAIAFVGFLICIIASVIMMRCISLKMGSGYEEVRSAEIQKVENLAYPIAATGFVVAILALVVFVIKNLLCPTV
jgi:DMSO/TMAO reductase YedYZ heme-binding membrane subunit